SESERIKRELPELCLQAAMVQAAARRGRSVAGAPEPAQVPASAQPRRGQATRGWPRVGQGTAGPRQRYALHLERRGGGATLACKDIDKVVEVVHRAGIARKVARLRPLGVLRG